MDTLFRLVSFQDHPAEHSSFTTTTTTSSTSSKNNHHHHQSYTHHSHLEEDDEECCNNNNHNQNHNHSNNYYSSNIPDYMDEDDFSSSKHNLPYGYTPTSSSAATTTPPHHSSSFDHLPELSSLGVNVDLSSSRWSHGLLVDCARAVSTRDSPRLQHLLWSLNELSSPYGDVDQKLSSYFLQALFARVTSTGDRCLRTLSSASDRSSSFDSTRRVSLRFQEASPWCPFGHVASNSSLLDALDGESRLHLVDLGTTFCTQWPTLLESLATRSSDDSPHLRLTTVLSSASTSVHRVMKEVGARMERFARLMGVPFSFRYVQHDGDLSTLDLASLCAAHSDEALAVNCVNSLHSIPSHRARNALLSAIRSLNPRIVTLVEEEAAMMPSPNLDETEEDVFLKVFRESLRFFSSYLDSLEDSFPKTSNERLALERATGRAVVDLVACDLGRSVEKRETGRSWSDRMRAAGFEPVALTDDGADDVKALLRRYKEGWSLVHSADSTAGIYLSWKEQPVVWASAWKPS